MKMRKYVLLILFTGTFLGVNAQFQKSSAKSSAQRNLDFKVNENILKSQHQRASSIDTIWFNDFSDTSEWSFQGGVNQWTVDSNLSQSLINQGFDPVLMSNSGGRFAYIDSDGAGGGQTQDATIHFLDSIDCSLYPNVQLVFETYFRKFNDVREVLVSNDDGVSWDTIAVLSQFGTSTTSPNPYTEVVDISAFAGGNSNVQIKFHYKGAYDWFWAIDDVMLQPVPNNELELTQEFYNGIMDQTYRTFYSMIPKRQADSAIINFGASVQNNGVLDQTNTQVSVVVKFEGNSIHSDTTINDSLVAGDMQHYNFPMAFALDSGLGVYDLRMTVFSDSADALFRNNEITQSFEVSSYQYRRDNDTVNSDNWFDVNQSLEMLVRYEVYTEDSIVALSTYFPFNYITGRGLIEGDSISYFVYESANLNTPVSENSNYVLTAADVNSWVTLPLPKVKLEPGMYYVGFKLNGSSGSVGTNAVINSHTAPLTVLLRMDATSSNSPWQTTTAFMPFVRMFTHSDSACRDVNIGIEFTVIDSLEIGQIHSNVVGTGAAPYIYSWNGPNGFTSSSQNISNLLDTGIYILEVNDVFGCSAIDSVAVSGTVNVVEMDINNNFNVFPNPVSTKVYVTGKITESGYFQINVVNMLGMNVYSNRSFYSGDLEAEIDLTTCNSGMYLIHVSVGDKIMCTIPVIKN